MTIRIQAAEKALDVLKTAGFPTHGRCGGDGTCGLCAVRVIRPARVPVSAADRRHLSTNERAQGIRLACSLHEGDYLISRVTASPVAMQRAPDRIMTPTLWPGPAGPGIAVDLGTTTVMAVRFDAAGTPGPVYYARNLQRIYGQDVMSRVAASFDPPAARRLRALALRSIAAVIAEQTNHFPEPAWVAVVGNTVMHHLVAGLDTRRLGSVPFETEERGYRWRSVRLQRGERGQGLKATLVPPLGGLVGADALASMVLLARRLPRDPWLLADLGTNCELVLRHHGRWWFSSVPAGPAFEGGALSCGCMAGDGAVEHVRGTLGHFVLDVDGSDPSGLCGSAAIDVCARLRRSGSVAESGLLAGGEREILVDPSVPLVVTQRDVRELQKAKAAVEIGMRWILNAASISSNDLSALILSGAFAQGLDRDSARTIGLIPAIGDEAIVMGGNTALLGAGLCLDRGVVDAVRGSSTRVVLHTEKFAEEYAAALRLRPWT